MSKAVFFSTGGIYTPSMLGMLYALGKKGILENTDAVGGISSGSMIAAFLATQDSFSAVKQKVLNILIENSNGKAITPHYHLFNNILSLFTKESIFDDTGIKNILQEHLEDKELKKDLYLGYTNETRMCYITKQYFKGTTPEALHKYVHASMSIPIVFKGVEDDNGDRLADGGLFHTLPIEQIEEYVKDCMNKNIREAEIHLISASPFAFEPPKIVEKGFARPIKETVRLTKSLHNITIHNDVKYLTLFINNCRLNGFDLKIHNHEFPAKLMEEIDAKIPFENYNKISEAEVTQLFNIGENIIFNRSHELKFIF
tara:strand:+ start:902 stop:1843 length:942 start_codon:yes stop_codon:yes gene_type:complete